MIAVVKLSIEKPGTTLPTPQRRATLIRKAEIPRLRIEIGRAIICKMGRMKVLTTPMTTAATTADHKSKKLKPGTMYSTTRRVRTLIIRWTKRLLKEKLGALLWFILLSLVTLATAFFLGITNNDLGRAILSSGFDKKPGCVQLLSANRVEGCGLLLGRDEKQDLNLSVFRYTSF